MTTGRINQVTAFHCAHRAGSKRLILCQLEPCTLHESSGWNMPCTSQGDCTCHPQVDRGFLNHLHTACLAANHQSSHLDTTCRKSVYRKPHDGLRHLALTPSRCSCGSSLAEQTIQFTHRKPLEGSEPPECEPCLSSTNMWTEAC